MESLKVIYKIDNVDYTYDFWSVPQQIHAIVKSILDLFVWWKSSYVLLLLHIHRWLDICKIKLSKFSSSFSGVLKYIVRGEILCQAVHFQQKQPKLILIFSYRTRKFHCVIYTIAWYILSSDIKTVINDFYFQIAD